MNSYSNSEVVEALRKMDVGILKLIKEKNLDNLEWMLVEMGIFDYSYEDMFNDVILNLYKSVSRKLSS